MNVCMVGYGMMGVWHSEALVKAGAALHTVVGRRADAAAEFAQRFGYKTWTLEFDEALADPAIEIVVIASPSELHEEQAIKSLAAGKHTLIEIPLAMSLKGAERVVAVGEKSGRIYGLSHPMRFRRERARLLARTRAGEETIRHIAGRFFIKRLVNIGATGYKRSWVDNILWHHFCHFVDLGTYLTSTISWPERCAPPKGRSLSNASRTTRRTSSSISWTLCVGAAARWPPALRCCPRCASCKRSKMHGMPTTARSRSRGAPCLLEERRKH